ncbi:MFS transporter [Desulfobacula sp.]|uniref:MFS transporter n=1 Tax=Desulfobacula sp. TaxID=2593537 RepID=UPI0026099A96|nr:MFS transporter [Desulfobacula sp.]
MKNKIHYRWIVLLIFVSSQLVLSIAGYGWGALAPFLKKLMSLNSTQIGSIGSIFYFAAALSALPSGMLVDLYGVKKGLIGWLGITSVPLLLLSIFKPIFPIFIILAAISGLGYGIGNPVCSKGLFLWFDQNIRGLVFGIKQSAVTVGAAVSGILLVYLADKVGPFNALGIIGLAISVMTILSLIYYHDPIHPENISNNTTALKRGKFLSEFGELFANKPFFYLSLIMALLGLAQGVVISFLILYATEKLGYSLLEAGSLLTLVMISGAVGRILWGFISDRLYGARRKPVLIIISTLAVLTITALAVWDVTWPKWLLIPVLMGLGLSTAGWNSVALVLVTEISTESRTGTSVGLASTIAWFGLASGPIAFGSIIDHFGYFYAWRAMAFFCIFSLILCFLLPINEAVNNVTGD